MVLTVKSKFPVVNQYPSMMDCSIKD